MRFSIYIWGLYSSVDISDHLQSGTISLYSVFFEAALWAASFDGGIHYCGLKNVARERPRLATVGRLQEIRAAAKARTHGMEQPIRLP